VLAGGQSGEREVSFRSGGGVLDALIDAGIDAVLLDPEPNLAGQLIDERIGVVFNALHGGAGENGQVQAVLELLALPYTGCGVLASALTMDKLMTQAVLAHNGVPVPEYVPITDRTPRADLEAAIDRLGLPVVTKPAAEGSSLGVRICRSRAEAIGTALDLQERYGRAMFERFIDGTEITVGVLGCGERTRALPVLEIVPRNEFYDYEAKYTKGLTDLICPARISEAATRAALDVALEAHLVTGCHGISRCDMHVDLEGNVWVHEINSMPGLTETSDVPHEAFAAGMTYSDLVLEILATAFAR
jgi:D-alanine-D-alanine ligase